MMENGQPCRPPDDSESVWEMYGKCLMGFTERRREQRPVKRERRSQNRNDLLLNRPSERLAAVVPVELPAPIKPR